MGVHRGGAHMKAEVLDQEAHTSPPAHYDGREVLADGTEWDPTGSGNPAKVISLGGQWYEIANFSSGVF